MKVGVIFGGLSKEREISIKTGKAIANALKELGYKVVELEVRENIVRDILDSNIDVAFIALHGRLGEDGTVQGLLELLRIPYTGSSCTASAIGMDKIITKKIWITEGIRTPAFQVIENPEDKRTIDFPLVVKPPCEGSTIGVSIVKSELEYLNAIKEAFSLGSKVLLEKYIDGTEYTVSVLDGEAYTPIEIRPVSGFYDYTSKYTKGATEYIIPPNCSKDLIKIMMESAVKAYNAIGCSGAARVDFIVDNKEGIPYALEINTIPGMTETSLLPKAMAYHGIDFKSLVDRMLKSAKLHIKV
ncbi:MAG: D-alanine--D-alanine ligase [Proteobacteria bacterium]|nr:D-alanine--D-alanine ligase [Pseudomonadota bacterium]